MSDQPPSDPSPRRRDLGFDELIAILVAFASIGAVLWWGLSRQDVPISLFGEPESDASPLGPEATSVVPFREELSGSVDRSERDDAAIGFPSDPALQESPASSLGVPAEREPVSTPAVSGVPVAPSAVPVVPPVGLVVPPATNSAATFPDVPPSHWAYPFIAPLAERNIISGFNNGTFQPDQPITRTEYAALIETIFQQQSSQNSSIAFQDVAADFWGTTAINTAVKTGFLRGYPGNLFQPDQQIPRVQVLVSLVNGLQIAQPSSPTDIVDRYQDSDQIPAWALPSVAAATQANLVVNHPTVDTLNPNQSATRAEVAAMIHQALVAAGQLEPVPSTYLVRP